MRYGPWVGKPIEALKAASEGNYRLVMLGLMCVEIALLVVLVALEAGSFLMQWGRR